VQAGVNILVSGPTGSGKTTMQYILAAVRTGADLRLISDSRNEIFPRWADANFPPTLKGP
jgi:type IV secretory pathway ATPase VirB11/archaellum biosynthesis ATPase